MSIKWEEREVCIRLTSPLLGTVAKDPEVYKTYIESKKPQEKAGENESATVDEATLEGIEAKGWTGFHKDEEGLFLYDYLIKGFLKAAGNVLKGQLNKKNLRSKIATQVFVSPRRIHLGQDEPDDMLERPLRAQTQQGPRVTLARSDVINEGKEITFTVKWLKGTTDFSEKVLKTLLEYGQVQGLGQFRTGGYGAFEVISVSKVK